MGTFGLCGGIFDGLWGYFLCRVVLKYRVGIMWRDLGTTKLGFETIHGGKNDGLCDKAWR